MSAAASASDVVQRERGGNLSVDDSGAARHAAVVQAVCTCSGPCGRPAARESGPASPCERGHVYERYQQRESTNLLSSLPEDALVHVLLHACSGRGGHRTALRLSRVSVLISTLLRHRLWKHLCVHESGPLAEAGGWRERLDMSKLNRPPWGSWAHLHRGLSVLMRFETPVWAWRKTDSRSFNSARSVKGIRVQAQVCCGWTPPPPSRRPSAAGVWRDAEPLLSGATAAPHWPCPDWPRQPDTPPAILCIARVLDRACRS